jgi:dihydroneopterin aldolase
MDIVFIEGLEIETVIGVYGWEREVRQRLRFDLQMAYPVAPAAASDDLAEALNYKAVADRLISYVESTEFELVETLAERCAAIIRSEFAVPWLRLKLSKPGAVPEAQAVGVIIERGSKGE